MYKIYRSNNYFILIDSRGTYFEEQCENVFVTKRKEGDQTYTVSFLRQETLRGSDFSSQSFPGINFSDIVDEFDAPYASVAAWEDFYTTNTGLGYLLASLSATGLATETTLGAVDTKLSSVIVTPSLIRATGAGTIAAGAYSFSVANTGLLDGILLGVVIRPGEVINFDAGTLNNTYGSVSYDGTGTELLITVNS